MTNLALNLTATPVQADTPCNGCGYNLRGLAREAACPECGTSVAHSLRGDALWFAPPRWLASLHAGALFLIVASIIQLIHWFVYHLLRQEQQTLRELRWVLLGSNTLNLLLSGLGIIWLTTREPRHALSPPRGVSAALLARIAIVPYALLYLLGISARTDTGSALSPGLMSSVQLVNIVTGIVLMVCLFLHSRRLAGRMHRGGLAASAWIIIAGTIIRRCIYFVFVVSLLIDSNTVSGNSWLFDLLVIGNWLWLGECVLTLGFWCIFALALRRAKSRATIDLYDDAPQGAAQFSRSVSNPA